MAKSIKKHQHKKEGLAHTGHKLLIPPKCGGDVPMFEPKTWLKFKDLDKSILELRAMFKQHPE